MEKDRIIFGTLFVSFTIFITIVISLFGRFVPSQKNLPKELVENGLLLVFYAIGILSGIIYAILSLLNYKSEPKDPKSHGLVIIIIGIIILLVVSLISLRAF